jgi:hypothetical protein
MEQIPSWEAASHSASQEIPRLLWNPKVHYQPLATILNQMHPVHILPSCFCKMHSNIFSHLRLGVPNGLFPSGFRTNISYAFLVSSMHATCCTHLILFALITLLIFGDAYKLWCSSLCSLLQPPRHFLHLRSRYSPQHPVLKHLRSEFFPYCERTTFIPVQKTGKIIVLL